MVSPDEQMKNMVQIPISCKSAAEEKQEETFLEENESTVIEDNDQDETYIPDSEASSISTSSDSFFDTTSDQDITLVEQQIQPKRIRKVPDWYTNLCIAECDDSNDRSHS